MPPPHRFSDVRAGTEKRVNDRRSNAVDLVEVDSVQRLDLGDFFLPSLLVAVATVVVGLTHRLVAQRMVRLDIDHPFAVLDVATATMTVPYAGAWVPAFAVVSAAGIAFACRGSRRLTAVGHAEARIWFVCMVLAAIAILPMVIVIVMMSACVALVAAVMAGLGTLAVGSRTG